MDNQLENYKNFISQVGVKDGHELSRLLQVVEKRKAEGKPYEIKLSALENAMSEALNFMTSRHARLPKIDLPDQLPISQKAEDIADAIKHNQVVVLAGETGSGKTTQIPKICLSLGLGVRGRIGHTQPRRIAARTVASRIAEELGTELGDLVGYQVRFTDHTQPQTFIKLMTDGILLAEVQRDPHLLAYDTIIIDEAHERSLNIDFLFGYLKRLLPKRPDLKIIITSATIDLEKFSKHFNNAPIIEVSGRSYPVETLYRPWQEEHEDINDAIVASINEILTKQPRGDILVFLSGEREIREASHAIKKANFTHLEILPLYARLSLAEQNRVFQNHKGNRVVLSTNVAETSLTVPGIKYVIDPGYARISRYSVRTKVQRLPIEAIAQASANQRKGRCGRVSEGVCYRLYDEDDFLNRPEFTDAEILRTNLAAVILQMLQMNIGDIRDFPFIDRPDKRLVRDGYKLLEEIKAVSAKGKVTSRGRALNQLPIDPRLGAVVIEANKLGCLKEALIIVSALSVQDPRERPAEKKQQADEKHRRFWDEDSDFVAYVNLWNYFDEQRQELSQNQLRKLCGKEFINYLRMREWRDLHHQLKVAVKKLGYKENNAAASYESLHKALICGNISQIGFADQESKTKEYFGTRNKKFLIFPGSSQTKKKHKWILAAEFIETSQLFAHCVAKISPEWVLEYAEHLVKHHYFEPHYNTKSGQVQAYMRSTLLGLVLQEKKRVGYNKIAPEEASDIFIRAALVEGKYRGKGEFFQHNQKLIEDIQDLEAKSRRRDILVDDEVVFEFYRARIPKDISNLKGFEHWREQVEGLEPKCLFLSSADVMLHQAEDVSAAQFPDELQLGDYTLSVVYCFEPGKINDGVNLLVPVEVLHDIPGDRLEWVVPGILRDKCIALVKSLPKSLRKHFVPVPQYVDKVLPRLQKASNSLIEALSASLSHISNVKLEVSDWGESNLDDFYRINIQVIDERGNVIDQSRDLDKLRQKYRDRVQKTLSRVGDGLERKQITSWDFGEWQESITLERGNIKMKAYPALVKHRDSVEIKILDNPSEATHHNQHAVLRLASIKSASSVKYLKQQLLRGKDMALSIVDLGKRDEVIDDIILAAIRDTMFPDGYFPESEEKFLAAIARGKSSLVAVALEYEQLLVEILTTIVAIKKSIKSHPNPLVIALAANDIKSQLDHLVFKQFLLQTPMTWLRQFPRYLRAIELRLEKMGQNPSRDRQNSHTLSELWEKHEQRLAQQGEAGYQLNSEWQTYRWMLEELRVSYFAQSLKTLMPVSEKRIKKQWQLSLSRSSTTSGSI